MDIPYVRRFLLVQSMMACLAALSRMPQASSDYLGYNIFCKLEIDVNAETVKFLRILQIISLIFKPSSVSGHKRIQTYDTCQISVVVK